jgi:hypothetical protein
LSMPASNNCRSNAVLNLRDSRTEFGEWHPGKSKDRPLESGNGRQVGKGEWKGVNRVVFALLW